MTGLSDSALNYFGNLLGELVLAAELGASGPVQEYAEKLKQMYMEAMRHG
jgi:hypothetical protein